MMKLLWVFARRGSPGMSLKWRNSISSSLSAACLKLTVDGVGIGEALLLFLYRNVRRGFQREIYALVALTDLYFNLRHPVTVAHISRRHKESCLRRPLAMKPVARSLMLMLALPVASVPQESHTVLIVCRCWVDSTTVYVCIA